MRIAGSIDSENVYTIIVNNPFDGNEQRSFTIPLEEMIQRIMFTAQKQFITEKLKEVYTTNADIYADDHLWNRFALCVTQVLTFSSIDTLITHLLKYRDSLQGIPEFNEVLTYLNIKANV